MTENNILSRQNTLWMQGVSALIIMLMHFVMQLEGYPRFFNIFGSVAVAVFLFISGFGINESYKTHSINNFWKKRFLRVIIPCWTIFLFQLPFVEHFNSVQLLKNLTFYASDLWFVDYIIRWYLVYWISRRFFTKNTKYILFAFGIYNVFLQQLYRICWEAEQTKQKACIEVYLPKRNIRNYIPVNQRNTHYSTNKRIVTV